MLQGLVQLAYATEPEANMMKRTEVDPMEALRHDFLEATSFSQKQDAIERHCEVLPIDSASDIDDGDLLLAISEGQQFLLRADTPSIEDGALRASSAMDGLRLKPLSLEKVNLSIHRSKLHRLVLIGNAIEPAISESAVSESAVSESTVSEPATAQPEIVGRINDPPEYQSKISVQQRDQILDSGAFSQLVDAAQRSGIVPGIGIIIQVRDCEFRLGKYHQALQLIESLLSSFVGSATQRTQRLKREEQDIASGRVKMSPKDLQAKRARDNKATESVERARMKFTRVLEGIRGIIQLENEKEQKF